MSSQTNDCSFFRYLGQLLCYCLKDIGDWYLSHNNEDAPFIRFDIFNVLHSDMKVFLKESAQICGDLG